MRRHSFDGFSFVLGVLFAFVGIAFLFGNADVADLHLAVVWPLPLILIGVLMLVSTIQRRNRLELQPAPAPGAVAPVDPVTEPMPRTPATVDQHATIEEATGIDPAPATGDIDPAPATGDIDPAPATGEIDGLGDGDDDLLR
jgi:hypothetical protein